MEVFGTIVRFFQNGGLFMYPIVIILAIGLSIAIERYIYLTRSEAGNRKLWEKLQPLLSNGDYAGAFEVSSKSEAAVGQVLAYGISRIRTPQGRVIYQRASRETGPVQAISNPYLYYMNQMLRGVMTSGTGRSAAISGRR